MKTELKAKFLQHILNKKNENEGFTLIELLVVIIIIGILSAIALPSFLNQANKAKQSEAKTYTGSMNRAQQAYYLEQNTFTTSIGALGLGIATQTINYTYTAVSGGDASSINNRATVINASAPLKAYVGAVEVTTQQATSEATTVAVLCESNNAMVNGGANASTITIGTTAGAPTCPSSYVSLAK
ncbi:prepilin-type N-terminal cleavage/methylation domain-containing protein [Nostoc sp. KVJ3]|uniref:type IV pilin-like G/H family protein n=1 Tax=Nostoc sp. KVJ3 TaxID=457945 RepID=UPI0022389A6F|nr:type IV pilin-like G/H family protein [Nostoc sp. KVJ3]MCW5314648.1 prepilin-type N-terminal cleavage/methylation domain-containing protein [Nostoc sp. KVJ3]